MLYRIRHITEYGYSQPVSLSQNQARLRPRNTSSQECIDHTLTVYPRPSSLADRDDYFGNHVVDFYLQSPHTRFNVLAESDVVVDTVQLPSPEETVPWDQLLPELAAPSTPHTLDASEYVFPSCGAPVHPELREYALKSFTPGRPVLSATLDLMTRIHREFKYDKTATTVSTPVMEVFSIRKGVCQDFAHLMIACLRSLKLAARYVSGYLRTMPPPGKPRMVGADASHAWLGVFVPPGQWIDIDPTNSQPVNDAYITVAWGRDYHDVSPLRGIFLGGGAHTLRVSVDVAPVDASDAVLANR